MTKRVENAVMGRPYVTFDLELVASIAALQCTNEEMAAVLGCSVPTLRAAKRRDPDLLAAVKKGQERGKASLRRSQFAAARGGNITMMIWLGKNWLGQTDRHDVRVQQVRPVMELPKNAEEARKILEVEGIVT